MQNFTLGKKGISMLFLTFILLIGSLPSYGQTCPSEAATPASQEFCYLQTVGDIVTDGDAIFQTANVTTDTQPIPDSEILESGTYYAGSSTGTCARIAITVNVTAEEYPDNTLYPGSTSFSISPCLNTDFTAEDLAGFFTAEAGYSIRVYDTQFGTGLTTGQLEPNDSYFVGQVYTGGGDASANCPSLRVAVGYNPSNAPAPTATSPQVFCEGATVADLQAQGTSPLTQAIRWYRTDNSFQPLPESTILITGQTYYASQIINDRNDPFPPCESQARAAVLVTVQETIDFGTPVPEIICEADIQDTFPDFEAIANFYLAQLPDGIPIDGTFSPTAEEIAAQYAGPGDYSTTYTVIVNGCESSVTLTATVIAAEEANAGSIADVVIACDTEELINLSALPNDTGSTGGTFFGEGVTNGIFNPSIGAGTYTITYSVDENADCIIAGTSDSTTFTITVQGSSGEPIAAMGSICETEVEAFPDFEAIGNFLFSLIPGVAQDGTFDPTVQQLAQQYNGPGDYVVTYTLNDECGTVYEITVTVNPVQDAEAGTISNMMVACDDEEIIVLNDALLSDDATPGGTFTGEGLNSDGNFDPSAGPGTYTITYSVDDSANCVTPGTSDSTTFTITVQGNSGEPIAAMGSICETEVEAFPDFEAIANYLFSLIPGVAQDGTFDPSIQDLAAQYSGPGDYVVTYTLNDECGTVYEITVTVIPTQDAEAGTISNMMITCDDEEIIVLSDALLSDNATTGGTFTGEGLNADGNFDPSVGPGTYTITYSVDDSANCVTPGTSDSTTFTITVQGNSGEPIAAKGSICETEVEAFPDFEAIANYLFSLIPGVAQDGTFDPSIQDLAAQYSGPGDYVVTYTLNDECGTVYEITVTVIPTQDAEAGTISNMMVACDDEEIIVLNDALLSDNATTGGTFTGEGLNADGNFDPSAGPGTYTITYSVNDSANCVTPGTSDSTTFTITVQGNSGEPIAAMGSICETEVEAFPDFEAIANYLFSLIPGVAQDGTFDPSIQDLAAQYSGPGDYVVTYTLNDECGTVYEITVTVIPTQDAEAGTISNMMVTCDDEEIIVLSDALLSDDATTGGSFSGEGLNADGNFDPSVGPGTYTITYSVDDSANCVTPGTSDSTTFTITVQGTSTLGDDIVLDMCITEAITLFNNPQAAIDMFYDLLDERNADLTGTFAPSLELIGVQLLGYISNPTTASQTFQTTYTVNTACGEESVGISLTINNTVPAATGEINDFTVCSSATNFDLNSVLTVDNIPDGTFFYNSMEVTNGMFDISEAGDYSITYTVSEENDACVSGTASETFTITVNEGDVFVGSPNMGIICRADVQAFPDFEAITNYLITLLDVNVTPNGTFSPTVEELVALYNNDADGLGDFQITYTAGEGECQASVQLTVRVVDNVNAGIDGSVTLNENDAPVNLFNYLGGNPMEGGTWSPGNGTFNPATDAPGTFTYTVGSESCQDSAIVTVNVTPNPTECEGLAGVNNSVEACNSEVRNLNETSVRNLYFSLLEDGVPTNGTFNPSISQLINQYNMVSNYGDFTTTYTVTEGECSDSVVLTVTVIEANDAGADMNLSFCSTGGTINLFEFLSPYATTNGSFTGYANGTFNPATASVGVTTITYVVEDDNSECSEDNFTSTFTITVTEPQAANAGGNVDVTYCIDQDETIQLTSLLGEGAITTGTFSAPFANGSFNPATAGVGVYPITYTVSGDCITGTATATITVTIQGVAEAPTAAANQSFCLVGNPTVADLVAQGAEGAELTWYSDADLTTVVPATTALVNNAVYYVVASTGDSACETSEAVMVTVTLNTEVSPTVQPEGNEFCRQDSPTVQDLIANLNGTNIRIYTSSTGGTALANTEALVDGVIYYATSTNATTGCESSERRAINVEVGFCGIPEGFSPNGDGTNDRFVIPDIAEDYPNYTIEIFNRWGNVVFKGNANTPDWDGVSNQSTTLGDKVLPAGVYFYIVNYNDGSTPPVQGKLYLSR